MNIEQDIKNIIESLQKKKEYVTCDKLNHSKYLYLCLDTKCNQKKQFEPLCCQCIQEQLHCKQIFEHNIQPISKVLQRIVEYTQQSDSNTIPIQSINEQLLQINQIYQQLLSLSNELKSAASFIKQEQLKQQQQINQLHNFKLNVFSTINSLINSNNHAQFLQFKGQIQNYIENIETLSIKKPDNKELISQILLQHSNLQNVINYLNKFLNQIHPLISLSNIDNALQNKSNSCSNQNAQNCSQCANYIQTIKQKDVEIKKIKQKLLIYQDKDIENKNTISTLKTDLLNLSPQLKNEQNQKKSCSPSSIKQISEQSLATLDILEQQSNGHSTDDNNQKNEFNHNIVQNDKEEIAVLIRQNNQYLENIKKINNQNIQSVNLNNSFHPIVLNLELFKGVEVGQLTENGNINCLLPLQNKMFAYAQQNSPFGINICSVENQKLIYKQSLTGGHTKRIWKMIKILDKFIASVSADKTICLWNWESGTLHHIYKEANCFKNSNIRLINQDQFVYSDNCFGIKAVELSSLNTVFYIQKAHSNYIYDVLPIQHQRLVSSSIDQSVKIWDYNSQQLLYTINLECVCYTLLDISDKYIALGLNTGSVIIIKKKDYEQKQILSVSTCQVSTLMSIREELFSVFGQNTIKIWNWKTKKCIKEISCPYQHKMDMCTIDEQSLLTASHQKVILWN